MGVTLIFLVSSLLGVFHPTGLNTVSFCCCSVAKSGPNLCHPVDYSTPSFPVLHSLPKFAQIHVHWVGDAIQPSDSLPPTRFSFCLQFFPANRAFSNCAWYLHSILDVIIKKLSLLHQGLRSAWNGILIHERLKCYPVKVMDYWMTPSHWASLMHILTTILGANYISFEEVHMFLITFLSFQSCRFLFHSLPWEYCGGHFCMRIPFSLLYVDFIKCCHQKGNSKVSSLAVFWLVSPDSVLLDCNWRAAL